MDTSVVYLLWDPRNGLPRWVGLTSVPKRRFSDHRAGRGRSHCVLWERELGRYGLACETFIIEEGLSHDEANERERWWIAYGRRWHWPLLNFSAGGPGVSQDRIPPERLRQIQLEYLVERRKRKSDAMKRYWARKKEGKE